MPDNEIVHDLLKFPLSRSMAFQAPPQKKKKERTILRYVIPPHLHSQVHLHDISIWLQEFESCWVGMNGLVDQQEDG